MNVDDGRIQVINDVSLKVLDEDHTLLNAVRWAVSSNWLGSPVEFCGYTIPHPSEKVANFNLQFADQSEQSPKNVLKKVYEGLECVEIIASTLIDKLDKKLNTE